MNSNKDHFSRAIVLLTAENQIICYFCFGKATYYIQTTIGLLLGSKSINKRLTHYSLYPFEIALVRCEYDAKPK
jgi:hypothetical protein